MLAISAPHADWRLIHDPRDDIQADLEACNIEGVETAFRALVNWPHEDSIEGATPHDLGIVLKQVCEALAGDTQEMPDKIAQRLLDEYKAAGGGGSPVVFSYNTGAALVLQNLERWRARFFEGQSGA